MSISGYYIKIVLLHFKHSRNEILYNYTVNLLASWKGLFIYYDHE